MDGCGGRGTHAEGGCEGRRVVWVGLDDFDALGLKSCGGGRGNVAGQSTDGQRWVALLDVVDHGGALGACGADDNEEFWHGWLWLWSGGLIATVVITAMSRPGHCVVVVVV